MKIELKKLRYVYPSGEEALKGVDLIIEGTDPVALIGQNGAGKTTVVKHLNGILRPVSGRFRSTGKGLKRVPRHSGQNRLATYFKIPMTSCFWNR